MAQARQSWAQRGLTGVARDARNYLAFHVLKASTDFTQQRYRLSERLARECDYTIRYGPFAGMRFTPESWWSAADRGAMILGLYEQEVLQSLARLAPGRHVLVDVGAADGYYAIGCLKAGWVDHVYCYEMSQHGQEAIRTNARHNGCEERITILGEARPGFMGRLQTDHGVDPSRAIVIMDVEGGEQDLLTASELESMSTSISIIEMHEQDLPRDFINGLETRATQAGLTIDYLTTQARDPAAFPELSKWSDDDRWMLCSEGRTQLMRWAILVPREHSDLLPPPRIQ